jgi:hypothetical protein
MVLRAACKRAGGTTHTHECAPLFGGIQIAVAPHPAHDEALQH